MIWRREELKRDEKDDLIKKIEEKRKDEEMGEEWIGRLWSESMN